uniref:phosphopantetheine-binding protein n=1 Tax=Spongiimicrobium salis TaxID=1667022 RepID=UPI00374D9EC8
EHGPIGSSVVLAREVPDGSRELVAYVAGEAPLNINDLRSHLSKRLPGYMIPSGFVQLAEMPLTPNGKIDRKALLKTDMAQEELIYTKPENEVQLKLTEIWGETLGIEKDKIGIKDNFFILGGNSIKMIMTISKIHEQFDIKIEFKFFFQNPFIESIAKYIQALSVVDDNNVEESQELYL